MFNKIMVPVDLRHVEKMGKALSIVAELATTHDADVIFVGVTSPEPNALGHNPKEYEARLKEFASSKAAEKGYRTAAHMIVAHDPAIDLDKHLLEASKTLGTDLVVMATHLPNVADYVWASHGGHLAAHAQASVFLVRG
ncbi:universal stress protein UspA [Thioclava sp. L04-15]|jgi:nucleotide-binding universal stress UspA family protein|uniref:universal stress protein n=1 Tax=Thioclava sp. L04-15 TaxID=1915318 RepID=UPI000995EC13|nr:universal stress protein [Thioclava sp. L04-15]OOY27764.1 universal stress protein UspA [Thioclava sp. L04-15]TNE89288.1 MAG: universal stress protein [Paracoccaceae bacterium]